MYRYHRQLARHETRRCLVYMLPPGLLDLLRLIRYRRRYPGAVVTGGSRVDQGAKIAPGVIVRNGIIGSEVEIGRFTTLGEHCQVIGLGSIRIGQFCSIGPGCSIRSDNHKLDRLSTYPFAQVTTGGAGTTEDYDPIDVSIGNDVWMGEGAMVLPGACIGDGCVIAAGAVVPRGDYEPFSILGGVPAKVIRKRLREEEAKTILADPWWDHPEAEIFGELQAGLSKQVDPG